MNLKETQTLLAEMSLSVKQRDLQLFQIGNGEYVVIVKPLSMHIWTRDEWLKNSASIERRLRRDQMLTTIRKRQVSA